MEGVDSTAKKLCIVILLFNVEIVSISTTPRFPSTYLRTLRVLRGSVCLKMLQPRDDGGGCEAGLIGAGLNVQGAGDRRVS